MALYKDAVKELIPPGVNDPKIIPIGVILHTDAGNVGDLHDYFDGPSGGIESHFHIPKRAPVLQYRDTSFEADANFHGNSFVIDGVRYGFISVETQGLASDSWNDYQLAEIKKLILWARSVHPRIQLRVCPAWNAAGIGYHTLFGSPGPWTPVAKSCPGPKRIKQFNDVLVPWFKTASIPPKPDVPVPAKDWFDMATKADLDELFEKWTVSREHWDSQAWAYLATAIAAAQKSMEGVDVTPQMVATAQTEARAALSLLEASFD